jgi:phosphoadenosine phosphosulfate reductase
MNENIYWCKNCKVPVISSICSCGNETKYCASDLKPVFPKEKELFESLLGVELPQNSFRLANRFVFNGETLLMFKIIKNAPQITYPKDTEKIKSKVFLSFFDNSFDKRLIKANKPFLIEKEKEAIDFIRQVFKEYGVGKEVYTSFSGGKDSAVTAYLVKKALGERNLFFTDTTLEFPETGQYVIEFAKSCDFDLQINTPPRTFFELYEELGPPSRMMRWCCTAVKASAINNFYREKEGEVLCFLGIRSKESNARRIYERVHKNKKIGKQLNAYPILNWLDFDVWIYAQYRNIPMNPVYQWGHPRIGCWACPSMGKLDMFLTSRSHADLWYDWQKRLFKYAKENGKDERWVKEGQWTSRRVRYNMMPTVLADILNPCSTPDGLIDYDFGHPVSDEIIEFLKPFGEVERDNGMFVIIGKDLEITGFPDEGSLTLKINKNPKLKFYVERQITKYLNCIRCGGCMGACPNGAIIVDDSFRIDQNRCKHCLNCCTSKFLDRSCVAIHYKETRERVGLVS